MDNKLFEVLACPLCKGILRHNQENNTLICKADKLSFPIQDDIPVMLVSEATTLADDAL